MGRIEKIQHLETLLEHTKQMDTELHSLIQAEALVEIAYQLDRMNNNWEGERQAKSGAVPVEDPGQIKHDLDRGPDRSGGYGMG